MSAYRGSRTAVANLGDVNPMAPRILKWTRRYSYARRRPAFSGQAPKEASDEQEGSWLSLPFHRFGADIGPSASPFNLLTVSLSNAGRHKKCFHAVTLSTHVKFGRGHSERSHSNFPTTNQRWRRLGGDGKSLQMTQEKNNWSASGRAASKLPLACTSALYECWSLSPLEALSQLLCTPSLGGLARKKNSSSPGIAETYHGDAKAMIQLKTFFFRCKKKGYKTPVITSARANEQEVD